MLGRERVAPAEISLRPSVDLRYIGQWHELSVPLARVDGASPNLERLLTDFHAQHDLLFGYSTDEMPVEALAVAPIGGRRHAQAAAPHVPRRGLCGGGPRSAARPIWSPATRELVDAGVYDGTRLGPGALLTGPAVVELANTTIVAHDGLEVGVDRFGAFVLWRGEHGRALAERALLAERVGA